MKTVYKFPLNHMMMGASSRTLIATPRGSFKPLAVKLHAGVPTLWAEVDFGEDAPVRFDVKRLVEVIGTGHPVAGFLQHVDTLIFGERDQLVLHYYVDCRSPV